MKKLKMLGVAFAFMVFCTMGANAANINFSENSDNGKVTITHSLTKELKYQWVKVDAATYKANVSSLKTIVDELKPLYTAFQDAKAPLAASKAAFDKANSDYKAAIDKDPTSAETTKAREAASKAYNDYMTLVDKANAAIGTYNDKVKVFNEDVKKIAKYDDTKWQTVAGNDIAFDGTGYVNEDAAVLWIKSNETGTEDFNGKIYLWDGTKLSAEIDCNKSEEPVTPKPENPTPNTPTEEGNKTTNPKTGYALPVAAGIVVLAGGAVAVVLANKKKLFKQI